MNIFVIGLDIGQASDYAVMNIIQVIRESVGSGFDRKERTTELHLRYLQRFHLGTSFTDIVNRVKECRDKLLDQYPNSKVNIVFERNGVGAPVIEMAMKSIKQYIFGINTMASSVKLNEWNVPKVDLVTSVITSLERGRLKAPRELLNIEKLVTEMGNFKMKLSQSEKLKKTSISFSGQGDHDDFVLSLCLSVFFANRIYP